MTPRSRDSDPALIERDALPTEAPEGGARPDGRGDGAGAPSGIPSPRFPAALSRSLAGASARLARLLPGGNGSGRAVRASNEADAGFEDALRDAFRSAGSFEPRRPDPRPGGAAEPLRSDPAAAMDATPPASPDGPGSTTTDELDDDRLDGTNTGGSVDGNTEPEPAAGAPPVVGPAGENEREAGPTAPAALLEVPESVATTADDFFGGLVRRVERRP